MRITEQKEVTEVKSITTDILCNKCGGSCKLYEFKENDFEFGGLIEVKIMGRYFSSHLEDCRDYTFSICEKCLKELFESFKIAIATSEYNL